MEHICLEYLAQKPIMTIAFLSHYDFNLYRFRLPIMKELVKQGHKVYAISPKGEVSDKFSKMNIKHISYEINRKSLNPLIEIQNIYNIYKVLSKLELDILHSFTMKANIYSSLISYFMHHKLICSITGLGSFYINKNFKSKLIKTITKFLYKVSAKRADYFIFQNNEDKSLFIQDNIISKNKAILIRGSGIDIDFFTRDKANKEKIQTIKSKLNIRKDNIVITMIARIIAQKGVIEFIEAIDILKPKYPDIQAIFIGDSDNGNTFKISSKILEENKNISYIGFNNNIREYLFLSDIYVLPSYREGLSMSLLEASAMEVPLVSTNVAGCKDVIDDGINGFLCEKENTQSLVMAIEKLIVDNDRKSLAKASREKAIKEFAVVIVIKKHLELYYKIKKEN